MNGVGGANRSLGRFFEGDRGTEQRHDPVSGHLVDRALVVVDFVNQNFVNLIHNRVGVFDTQHLRQRSKALHVAEHHRHLLALAFDSIFLR